MAVFFNDTIDRFPGAELYFANRINLIFLNSIG